MRTIRTVFLIVLGFAAGAITGHFEGLATGYERQFAMTTGALPLAQLIPAALPAQPQPKKKG